MTRYKIALDDGHGMETPGKRTPKFSDGTFMHENEFNSAVVDKLDKILRYNGFETVLVAPTDKDTPLRQRTTLANSENVDFYMSVHANAYKGAWGNWGGISIFHYPGSTESEKAAKIIYKHAIKGTKLNVRGVKTANFHALRETHMPAALIECAFMDNKQEARLLMSDEYRDECAVEIARGICEYFGVDYKEAGGESLGNLEKWQEQLGKDSLKNLNRKTDSNGDKLVNSPDDWAEKLNQNVPMWLFWTMIDRITNK